MEVAGFLLALIAIAVVAPMFYAGRHAIHKMMHSPYETRWQPSRKTILKRHIEDANAELQELNEKEIKAETGED